MTMCACADDWMSILLGTPLSLVRVHAVSICFDLFLMFQYYILFWGKQPRDQDRVGYRRIEEKTLKGPIIKDVVSYSESNEATLLINGNDKMWASASGYHKILSYL